MVPTEFAGIYVHAGPPPSEMVMLLLQQFNRSRSRERLSIVQKPFEVKQNGFSRIGQGVVQSIAGGEAARLASAHY